MSGSFIYISMD